MKRFYLPIFWKFNIGIISIVVVFGLVNAYVIREDIQTALESESEKLAVYIALNMASHAVNSLLYEDYVAVQELIDEAIAVDSTIAYAFILDASSQVIVHSFNQHVPAGLIHVNLMRPVNQYHSQLIYPDSKEEDIIRDIAVPILQGKLGTVRLGLHEKNIRSNVRHTVETFWLMAFLFLLVGILGSFLFATFITNPIKSIQSVTDRLNFKALEIRSLPHIKIRQKILGKGPLLFRATDEIDDLADRFNHMIQRLENAYSELQKAQEKLVQSEKLASVGAIASGMAHEINNPIAGLKSCARRLQKAPHNIEQNKKYLDMMNEAADRIEKVVHNLLNFSRKQDIAFSPLLINDLIENSLMLISYKLEKMQITVTKQIQPGLKPVRGSSNHLEQVLVNLLINAVDAIEEHSEVDPQSPRKITFNASDNNSNLLLTVSDSGIGIKEDKMEHIFSPFYTTKSIGKGTGLGLAVSTNIIEAHGGSIKVQSLYNDGTTFRIKLPYYNSNNKDAHVN